MAHRRGRVHRPHAAPQVTARQLECLDSLAKEPSLAWAIESWKIDGFRALLARQESFEALVFTLRRLLDDADTAPLVKELLKRNSGIARLENDGWLAVSAPQSWQQRLRLRGMLACSAGHNTAARRQNDAVRCDEGTET